VASALADLKTLAKHPVYVLNVAATAVYTGTTVFTMAIQLHIQPQHCSMLSIVVQQRQPLLQLNLQGSPVEAPLCFFQFYHVTPT